ncbi:MAG: PIG-L family deacetylase [Oligoflexia bacterium]|nr:PIG-L family deacetylase [Oligoflexia bacterium]
MKEKAYRLLVVAHPDDETIFFGGLVQKKRDLPWHLICVTDGNADGRGEERKKELKEAAKILGIKSLEHWTYADKFPDRLPVEEITERLKELPLPKEIYTHGPLGEYGHPHHQDVCLATYRAFSTKKVYSPAWNVAPSEVIQLTPKQFAKKTYAFAEIYRKETSQFLNILPNSAVETFKRFTNEEVEALVCFIRREVSLNEKSLVEHKWTKEILPSLRDKLEKRLF